MAKNNTCGICNRKGKRACPALEGMICPACCGASRGSKLECPPECEHFPFGTEAYDLWLRIDGTWFPKAVEYVVKHVGEPRFREIIEKVGTSTRPKRDDEIEAGILNAVHYGLSVETDDEGRTLGERWEAEGWTGLNNDERLMTLHRRHTRPTIIEVQEILSERASECTDLLDPARGKFLVFDRATAQRSVRFSRYLLWLTDYPHFSRTAGSGMEIPSHLYEEYFEELLFDDANEDAPKAFQVVKRDLAERFAEYCDLQVDFAHDYRERALRSMDLKSCRASYELLVPRATIEAIINNKPDFEVNEGRELEPADPPGSVYFEWLRRGEAKQFEDSMPAAFQHDNPQDGVGILGALRLHDDGFLVETLGEKKFEFAKALVTRYFGSHVKLTGEESTDLAEQLLDRDGTESEDAPSASTPDGPPHPELPHDDMQELMKQVLRNHYQKFMDEPVPMIDNLTPRQAAADPEMRPRLIELMKLHIHGVEERARDENLAFDLDWVVKELGLTELQ
ncbi:MAG: hypothetical protein O2923_14595 [Verrucomicrobia bacterium]|nr:hypothetical protein [Verrucomicrobiota bacterium]MDA1088604.1 hypothetical protein [Verrucomicrobiota bacterium]